MPTSAAEAGRSLGRGASKREMSVAISRAMPAAASERRIARICANPVNGSVERDSSGRAPVNISSRHDAQRIEVGACIDLLTVRLLRSHVGGRTGARPMPVARKQYDPEVDQHRRVVAAQDHVVGLEIAMDRGPRRARRRA